MSARDDRARAQIVPLAPGERPPAIVVCAVLCALIAIANLVLWAAGWEVSEQELNAAAAIVPALLFGWLAYGLWQTRLLAIAATQVVLALTALFASGSLLVASDLGSAALSLTVITVCGVLFWPLIRVNARAGMRDRVEGHG